MDAPAGQPPAERPSEAEAGTAAAGVSEAPAGQVTEEAPAADRAAELEDRWRRAVADLANLR
jgi:hypothetical protein